MESSSSLALALVCALALAMAHTSRAQNSPNDFADPQDFARYDVGVAEVEWNDTLVAYARRYAKKRTHDCTLIPSNGPYGENLFRGSGAQSNAGDAVQSWINEKKYYDYDSNSCTGGQVCRHYTQVVWEKSLRLGCARTKCSSGDIFVICSYDPPGNIAGQRPYQRSS